MKTNNLFNMTDISDLPVEIITQLNLTSEIGQKLIRLFFIAKKPLGLSEVIVGAFREFGDIRSRQYYMTACYRLKKKGFLNSTKDKGHYELSETGKTYAKKTETGQTDKKVR